MNWTDERIEKLKKLWEEGFSASQIAAELPGVSRNAVIGKVHRLGLVVRDKASSSLRRHGSGKTDRNKAVRPRGSTTFNNAVFHGGPRFSKVKPVEQKAPAAVPATVQEEAPTSLVVVPTALNLPLGQLTEQTCKWPIGDPLEDAFGFCGTTAEVQGPYCSYHARLAYQPTAGARRRMPAGEHA